MCAVPLVTVIGYKNGEIGVASSEAEGLGPVRIATLYAGTVWKLRVPLLTISLMLALGYVTRYSGTDTDSIYHIREGTPSALVSLPLRYMHSVVEMAHLDDVEHTIQLLTALAESVKAKDEFTVKV
jgi:hypothetical protein